GRRAFAGEDAMAVLAKVLVTDLPRAREVNPRVPRALDRLIGQMLAKEASERPSAIDAARTLDGLTDRTASATDLPQARPPSSLKVPTLTAGERRVASVVMIRGAVPTTAGPDERTASAARVDERVERMRRILLPDGARVERLADGTVIAIVAGKGTAQD